MIKLDVTSHFTRTNKTRLYFILELLEQSFLDSKKSIVFDTVTAFEFTMRTSYKMEGGGGAVVMCVFLRARVKYLEDFHWSHREQPYEKNVTPINWITNHGTKRRTQNEILL